MGYIGGLLGGLCFLYGTDKLGPVILGIFHNSPKHIGNQGQHNLGFDSVLGGVERANRVLPILAAGVLWNPLAIVGAVDIHLATAVSAVHQACQRMGLPEAVRVASGVAPDTLHIVKGFLVDNGLMGIFKNRPLALIDIVAFLVLEVLAGFEIDGMPQILPLFQDFNHR